MCCSGQSRTFFPARTLQPFPHSWEVVNLRNVNAHQNQKILSSWPCLQPSMLVSPPAIPWLSVTSSIPQSYSLCGPSPTPLSSSLSLPCHCSHHLPSPLPSFSTSPSQSVSLSRPRPPSSPSSPAAPWLPFHPPCSWELANSTAPLSSVQGPSVHCCCSARQRQYAAVSPSTKRHGSLDLALQEKSKLRIDEKFI